MKLFSICAAIVVLFSGASGVSSSSSGRDVDPTDPPAGDITQGLVAYFPFNGNTTDYSGNNNHVVFNNATPTLGRDGAGSGGYYFDGAGSYMRVANHPTLNPQTITLYAVVRVNAFYHGPCHGNVIIHKGDQDYDLARMYRLRYDDNLATNQSNCFIAQPDTLNQSFYGDIGGNSPISSLYTPRVVKDVWTCVAFTYDGSIARLYINGTLVQSKNTSRTYIPTTDDLFIGKLNVSTHPYYFNGIMDELRIYNRALSAQEVAALCGTVETKTNSPVVTKNNDPKTQSTLRVFPNPANSRLQLNYVAKESGFGEIRIMDAMGKIVHRQIESIMQGTNMIPVNNIQQLANGTYIVEVIMNGRSEKERFVIQR